MKKLLYLILLIPYFVFGQIDTAHYLTKPVPAVMRTDTNATNLLTYNQSTHTANLMSGATLKAYFQNGLLSATTAASTYQVKGTYLTSINSSNVTTALGYTPYNGATNPNGYLTSVSYPVTSVFGRTGAITASVSDYSSFYYPLSSNPSNYLVTAPSAAILNKTANYTILSTDFGTAKTILLSFDCTSGNLTATLPSASTVAGYTVILTKTDATTNTLTISGATSDNIIGTQKWAKSFISAGGSWIQN